MNNKPELKFDVNMGAAAMIPGRTTPLFNYPTPNKMRDCVLQARLDSLRVYGITDVPGEEPLNPLDVALEVLHNYTADGEDVLKSMMEQIGTEKAAAIERAEKGLPNPKRMDELGTMTSTECMRVMAGLFSWSIELEESLMYCMLEAGEFIAYLYGGMDGETT